jgi:hypothetical protein
MGVTLVPNSGSTVKNFQIVTAGSIFDDVACTIIQGTFASGNKLNDPNGCKTNYSGVLVSIRQGGFTLGKEDGTIFEFVFAKTSWDAFIDTTTPSVSCTKYTHTFSNGSWTATTETLTGVNIKGTVTRNTTGRINSFSFVEVV